MASPALAVRTSMSSKAGVDPLVLMTEMAKSYYSQFSGFSKDKQNADELIPLDIKTINYDWEEIKKVANVATPKTERTDLERLKTLLK